MGALALGIAGLAQPSTTMAQGLEVLLEAAPQATTREPTIGPFGPGDERKSERQRERVKTLARSELGLTVGIRTATDLDALQRLIDERHVRSADTYLQQSLGLVLGDALARDHRSLSWVVLDDRYGHSRALRYRDSDQLFFPVTMISKRLAVGEPVVVRDFYQKVQHAIAELDDERETHRLRERGRQ